MDIRSLAAVAFALGFAAYSGQATDTTSKPAPCRQ
jgi:hypothetical protein